MTQQEYDSKMATLNAKMQEELKPLTAEYNKLQAKKDILKGQIFELASKKHEIGLQMRDICDQRNEIRARYTIAKQLIYIERPTTENQPTND